MMPRKRKIIQDSKPSQLLHGRGRGGGRGRGLNAGDGDHQEAEQDAPPVGGRRRGGAGRGRGGGRGRGLNAGHGDPQEAEQDAPPVGGRGREGAGRGHGGGRGHGRGLNDAEEDEDAAQEDEDAAQEDDAAEEDEDAQEDHYEISDSEYGAAAPPDEENIALLAELVRCTESERQASQYKQQQQDVRRQHHLRDIHEFYIDSRMNEQHLDAFYRESEVYYSENYGMAVPVVLDGAVRNVPVTPYKEPTVEERTHHIIAVRRMEDHAVVRFLIEDYSGYAVAFQAYFEPEEEEEAEVVKAVTTWCVFGDRISLLVLAQRKRLTTVLITANIFISWTCMMRMATT